MKNIGLIISIFGHIIVLGWGLFVFTTPSSFDAEEIVMIPIEVTDFADTVSARKGDDEAAFDGKPKPKEHQRDDADPNAKNVGAGDKDTDRELKPKERDNKVEPATPNAGKVDGDVSAPIVKPENKPQTPPAPQTPPKPEPEPKPEPKVEPKPEQQPKAEEQAQPEPTVKPDAAEPQITPETPSPANPQVAEQQEPLVDTAPKLPTSGPVPMMKPVETAQTPPSARGEQNATSTTKNNQALVNNQRDRGGATGSSTGPSSKGADKNVGDDGLAQTVQNLVGSCIQRNANIGALAGRGYSDLYVELRFQIGRDGLVDGSPKLTPRGGDEASRETFSNQVLMALYQCEGTFKQLPMDKYEQWRDLKLNVKYGGM